MNVLEVPGEIAGCGGSIVTFIALERFETGVKTLVLYESARFDATIVAFIALERFKSGVISLVPCEFAGFDTTIVAFIALERFKTGVISLVHDEFAGSFECLAAHVTPVRTHAISPPVHAARREAGLETHRNACTCVVNGLHDVCVKFIAM